MTAPVRFGITAADFAKRAAAEQQAAAPKKSTLGKEDFLSILVAQLKNQDPLSPMEGTEFATQLAQFSNVEQLINISGKMDEQSAATLQNQITSQTALGASLIGREISFETKDITIVEGRETPLRFSLGAAATTVKVEVLNHSGEVVYTETLTKLPKGDNRIKIDTGLDSGSYTYKVTATGADKKAVSAAQYGTGTVSGVSFSNGQIMLHIGDRTIPLLEINEILAVPAGTSTSSTESHNS